jgi:hypothetical protein
MPDLDPSEPTPRDLVTARRVAVVLFLLAVLAAVMITSIPVGEDLEPTPTSVPTPTDTPLVNEVTCTIDGDSVTVIYRGDGSDANPFEISNLTELQCMKTDLSASYALVKDIDATETSSWNNGAGFEPIGGEEAFRGSLDGNGHEVTGLTINRPDTRKYVGMFTRIEGDGVTNIHIVDANVTGGDRTGVLAGGVYTNISDVHVTGAVTGRLTVGGLSGIAGGGSVIHGTDANVSVTGESAVGGLLGSANNVVNNSRARGDVSGQHAVGGLIGSTSIGAVVERTSATGSVTASGSGVGGLIGDMSDGDTVRYSFAVGDVNGVTSVGGLVGGFASKDGSSASIAQSYAAGHVTGDFRTGGLVGNAGPGGSVTASYWDAESASTYRSDGGTGLSTSEMTGDDAVTNMTGFEFGDVWVTSTEYPVIQLED